MEAKPELIEFSTLSCRNFVEKYIEKMSTSKEGSSFYGKVGRENLKHILLDFLVAGSETSSNTLMWIMLFLMKYPHIQERLVKELSKSFGSFHPSKPTSHVNIVLGSFEPYSGNLNF